MSHKKYIITLTADERAVLDSLLRKGKSAALVLTRARILLKADQADGGPAWDDARIPDTVPDMVECMPDEGPPSVGRRWWRFW